MKSTETFRRAVALPSDPIDSESNIVLHNSCSSRVGLNNFPRNMREVCCRSGGESRMILTPLARRLV
ncbi:hypothetical protein NYV49_14100 [Escherichia coli]|nr:hypothetical protein [Escherichia coli]